MNLSSLLFFMFSFLLSGDAIFYIKDSLFTTNNLFDKFSQRDWEGQSYTQKTKVLDQYINQELALIEASQIGLAKDPYINVKTKKRKEEQMVRFGFEWFSCFPSLSNKDLSFGQDKIVKGEVLEGVAELNPSKLPAEIQKGLKPILINFEAFSTGLVSLFNPATIDDLKESIANIKESTIKAKALTDKFDIKGEGIELDMAVFNETMRNLNLL